MKEKWKRKTTFFEEKRKKDGEKEKEIDKQRQRKRNKEGKKEGVGGDVRGGAAEGASLPGLGPCRRRLPPPPAC
jgi:hypothetical protein